MRKTRTFVLALAAALAACGGGDDSGGGDDAATSPDADNGVADAATAFDAGPAYDAEQPDALLIMSITGIIPQAASRNVDTELTVLGFNIMPGASMTLENCDTQTLYDLSSTVTVAGDGRSLTAMLAMDPNREQGLYTVTVTNPDTQTDTLQCAFRILAQDPPTVTDVVPSTAWRGMNGDNVNSDQIVTITGTNFVSTPHVRWVKTDNTAQYDALFVGYTSDTQITAIAPSETLQMLVGDYYVYVINPDQLGAQWLVDDGMNGLEPGIFTVTDTPPPIIDDIEPARIPNATCGQTMTITGSGFDANATVWWVGPPSQNCTGGVPDENGNTLCPVVVDNVPDSMTIEAHFDPCPPIGAWPIRVINPDNQADTFYNVEVRPNNSGHLSATDFELAGGTLNTARFKHGVEFGGDPFGNAYLWVVGGQDDDGDSGTAVALDTVEFSQLDIFGQVSPFNYATQYVDENTPRALNTLLTPRQGLAVVRVGRTLFAIGGASEPTDVTATVDALDTVERADILSFQEMPAVSLPTVTPGPGLPEGSWYYRVSAIGPWGESLASREVVALDTDGTVEVCWDEPQTAGATSYNIYRSLAPDGRAGTAVLTAQGQIGPCFVDDGADELTPAPGRLRGTPMTGTNLAEGTHTYRVSAVVQVNNADFETFASYSSAVDVTANDISNGNAALLVTWDPILDATYLLYKWDSVSEEFRLLDTGGPLLTNGFVDDGAAFDGSDQTPRVEYRSLPPGSLSVWRADVPALNTPREGLDGVVINMDPMTSNGMVARILVAGGRTQNTAGSYLTSAESLGLFDDGTMEAMWFDEAPQFNSARAFYSLLTTQGRNDTFFPPPPEDPPCGDLDGDGFISCDCAPPDTPQDQLDCNDADPDINPNGVEICGDGIDQDCDMGCSGTDLPCQCTDDIDGDGHISIQCGGDDCCDVGTDGSLGCSDTTAGGINPDELEMCGNGIDENCDMVDPPCACMDDLDMDGFISIECGGSDCCDTGSDTSLGCTDNTAPDINPDATEVCGNGVDDDCDGAEAVCSVPPDSYGVYPVNGPYEQFAYPDARWLYETGLMVGGERTLGDPWFDLVGGEPVYVVAVLGDDDFQASNNAGRSDMEACLVDAVTGHLACTQWTVQSDTTPQDSFGIDALLYFDYLYPFYGMSRETIGATNSRQLITSSIARFPVIDPTMVMNDLVLENFEAANVSPAVDRAYYKAVRLLSYIYLVGGWTSTGPSNTVERHLQ